MRLEWLALEEHELSCLESWAVRGELANTTDAFPGKSRVMNDKGTAADGASPARSRLVVKSFN